MKTEVGPWTTRSSRVGSFPALRPAAVETLRLLQGVCVDLPRLLRVVESDSVWEAELVRQACQPMWGRTSRPGCVREAMGVLGLRRFFPLTTLAAVGPLLHGHASPQGGIAGDLWTHSMAVALATREILVELGLRPCEKAFTAAIVHDVGRLLAASAEGIGPESPAGVPERGEESGRDHAEAGAALLVRWNMPGWLVASVHRHHQPPDGTFRIAELVHLAEDLCPGAGMAGGDGGDWSGGIRQLSREWNLSRQSVERIRERTRALLAETEEPGNRGEGR